MSGPPVPSVLDFSSGRPSAASILAAGYKGSVRYLPKRTSTWVAVVTASEIADYRAHNAAMAFVYEDIVNSRFLQGYAAGVVDGAHVLAQCKALGVVPRCVYFAADTDIVPSQYGVGIAYLQGVKAGGMPAAAIGVYGSERFLAACRAAGVASWWWITRAWLYGASPYQSWVHLYQSNPTAAGAHPVGGVSVEDDEILQADWGQTLGATPSAPAPVPISPPSVPIPKPEEADVPLILWTGDSRKHPAIRVDITPVKPLSQPAWTAWNNLAKDDSAKVKVVSVADYLALGGKE